MIKKGNRYQRFSCYLTFSCGASKLLVEYCPFVVDPVRSHKIDIKIRQEETMRQCMDAANLHRRLNKIAGQLKAIDKMIDEDVPCEDILIQINAAKGALHKVGQVVLEGHLNHCVRDGIEHGDAEKTIAEFAKAVEHFSRMS